MLYFLIFAALFVITTATTTESTTKKSPNWTFKDFIQKYSPSTAWEKIDKEKANGVNFTIEEETDKFIQAVDPTDELLDLPVVNGNAKILLQKNGRRWMPDGKFSNVKHDPWNLRYRIVELMKQAIYQARNKMVIMQTLREQYRNVSLYKMGYLIAKTDFATKTLAMFANRAMKACSMKRQILNYASDPGFINHDLIDIIYTQERQMQLWFEVDLMIELVEKNHLIAKRVMNKLKMINQKKWNDGRFIN